MRIGNRDFADKTYIMGILNITPDSFFDGNKFNSIDNAMLRAEQMIKDGADIIDVGGESTRPGYIQISDEEEIERIVPVIEKIKKNFDIPVSVDTYKSSVLAEAAKVGADMANDIWGFKRDTKMSEIVSKYCMAVCLMHNKKNPAYKNLTEDVISDLRESISIAEAYGIKNIIIDPGVGFAKSYEENIEIIRNISRLRILGCPILLGVSRKSVIANTLNLEAGQCLEGTIALSVYGAMEGCSFLRVHDVLENKRAVTMIERIVER